MSERKQSDKEIGKLLGDVRKGGWSIEPPKGKSNIYKAKCFCGAHLEHIHSTPSGAHYVRNKLGHMKKTCWKEAE